MKPSKPPQVVRFIDSHTTVVKVLPRSQQLKCDHKWVKTYCVHSWKYICTKCGACTR